MVQQFHCSNTRQLQLIASGCCASDSRKRGWGEWSSPLQWQFMAGKKGERKNIYLSICELKVLTKAIEIVPWGNSCTGSVKFCLPSRFLQLHIIPKLPLFWTFLTNPWILHALIWVLSWIPLAQHWRASYLQLFSGCSRSRKMGLGMSIRNFIFPKYHRGSQCQLSLVLFALLALPLASSFLLCEVWDR